MKLVQVIIIALTISLVTGCSALVDMAAETFAEMKDTNRYEDIRDSVELLCDSKNYDAFVDRYGKDTVDKWMMTVCNPVTREVNPNL